MSDSKQSLFLLAGGRSALRRRGPDVLLVGALASAGLTRPRVAYLGVASGDNAAFRAIIGGMLKKAGAAEVVLAPLCGKRGNPEKARDVLGGCDLVFVSGGDVEQGMGVLHQTRMTRYLRALYDAGKPFVGVSAGSIMLAQSWVRWQDPNDDASAQTFPCLGFAPLLCDTHGESEGWQELQALLRLSPNGTLGYGIASGTALVVDPAGRISALGGEVHRFRRRSSGVVQAESLQP
ncbi:MAG TPA: Type 1 glutamine amidotransferase-like domain-containing protein [Spirochaetia bacterium]|nr:Type 1 glutamine amidotransferase-like domain-containing protein [Spirochaetia bacterium]